MTLVIIILLGMLVEWLFKPRFDYVKESSVLVFYFFAAKNVRKRLVFKL